SCQTFYRPLACCAFFLSCSAAPPDLHSFPTRRSSDLEANVAIISMAQQARPNVTGQTEDLRAQFKKVSATVVTMKPPGKLKTPRSEEHTSELQSLRHLVCRLLLEKKNNDNIIPVTPTC